MKKPYVNSIVLQIVDDQEFLLRSLVNQLTPVPWFEKILTNTDGSSAFQTYKRERPDLLVVDVELPKMSGLRLAKAVADEKGSTRILMMSGFANEATLCGISRIQGIHGFIFKSAAFFQELPVAITRILRGECYYCNAYRSAITALVESGKRLDRILSQRERRILGLIGAGWSDEEISARIQVTESTVRWQTRQLRHKMGVNSNRELMKISHKVGLAGGKWEEIDLVDKFDIP